MAPTGASVTVLSLSDDDLRKIFLRLPSSADLLRAVLACTHFLRAAHGGGADFFRRFRRLHPSTCPVLLGCLLLPLPPGRGPPRLLPSPAYRAARREAQGGDFSLAFLPGGGWSAAPWEFLDSRNGLLLLNNNSGSKELAVADPLLRSCVSLPAPPADRPVGFGLVADDGDSSAFRVVCISRDGGSSQLRALVLSSSNLSWAETAGVSCALDLAGSRPIQAYQSLYWTLEGGENMMVFSMAAMQFSFLKIPPFLQHLSFDIIEKTDDGGRLHLLTMRGFCIEVWSGADDGAGGLTWTLVEKSVRFHKAIQDMLGSVDFYHHGLVVVGVSAGIVLLHLGRCVFSIDLETMKLRRLSEPEEDLSLTQIHPYTVAWPPAFLNPTEDA